MEIGSLTTSKPALSKTRITMRFLMPLEYEWADDDQLLLKKYFQCKEEKPKDFKTNYTKKVNR